MPNDRALWCFGGTRMSIDAGGRQSAIVSAPETLCLHARLSLALHSCPCARSLLSPRCCRPRLCLLCVCECDLAALLFAVRSLLPSAARWSHAAIRSLVQAEEVAASLLPVWPEVANASKRHDKNPTGAGARARRSRREASALALGCSASPQHPRFGRRAKRRTSFLSRDTHERHSPQHPRAGAHRPGC